jgi:hypothetical protein
MEPKGKSRILAWWVLPLLALHPVASCSGDGGAIGIGRPCRVHGECRLDLCLAGRCADPDDDPDRDGLPTWLELRLALDPLHPDTDRDEIPDGEEVGPDRDNPLDYDGDGRIDALESAIHDSDGDCVPDQFDPRDDVPDASAEEVVRYACSNRGVCGMHPERIRATCIAGTAFCDYSDVPEWRPSPEDRCDGRDNDCDGLADEGFALDGVPMGLPCMALGACGAGLVECGDDMVSTRCSSGPGGSADASRKETCNGLDDDCNGLADDGLAHEGVPLGQPCVGRGECGPGIVQCGSDQGVICSSEAGGEHDRTTGEICDGLDNDCNGLTDDEVIDEGGLEVCGVLKGVCARHPDRVVVRCEGGGYVCDYSDVPGYSGLRESLCDGLDDNCDGLVDEDEAFRYLDPVMGLRGIGQSCGIGACSGGEVICSGSGSSGTCSTLGSAHPETCDGTDGDCNGYVDNGLFKEFSSGVQLLLQGEPAPRARAAIVSVNGNASVTGGVYLYGGASRMSPSGLALAAHGDFWRFDTVGKRYQVRNSSGPGPRSGAFLLHDPAGSRLVLVGGAIDDEVGEDVWAYLIAEDRWVTVAARFNQDGLAGAAIDPETSDLVAVRMDRVSRQPMLARVSLTATTSFEGVLNVPYRTEVASAQDGSGRVFLFGGHDAQGRATADLRLVHPDGLVENLSVSPGLPRRAAHAMAVLSDGSLMIVGGFGGDGSLASDVIRVVPPGSSGSWRAEPAAGIPGGGGVLFPALVTSSGGTYMVSGMTSDGVAVRQVYRFDPVGGFWTSDLLVRTPVDRRGGGFALIPQKRAGFLFGGFVEDLLGSRAVTDLWSLSLDDHSFQAIPVESDGPPVFIHGAHAVDPISGDLFLHGGLDAPPGFLGGMTDRFRRLRIGSMVMEDLPRGPSARHHHAMAASLDGLYLQGGTDGETVLGDVWRWSHDLGWQRLSVASRPAVGHALFVDRATGFLVSVGGDATGTVGVLDPDTGEWADIASDPLLAADGHDSWLDPDSREILFRAVAGQGGLTMSLDGGELAARDAAAFPHFLDGPGMHDPFWRRILIFGGTGADGSRSNSLWAITQTCVP